jgi:hypothetical protein
VSFAERTPLLRAVGGWFENSHLFTIYLALFCVGGIGRNAVLLQTLTNNKWPPKVDSGGHRFVD